MSGPALPELQRALLDWYARARRELPWRQTDDPYAIWVAEVLLQQTQVTTVVPYYERFLKQFPSVRALAEAPLDAVLKVWEGLGYYARARRLHEAARVLVREHGGRLPAAREELLKLPGIGPYTAGAIASIAFGLDEPVLDGNVTRVLARLFRVREETDRPETRRRLWALARRLIPPGRAGTFNQALMELGATVCLPRRPRCPLCPLREPCQAHAHGEQAALPRRARRRPLPHHEVAVAVIWEDGKLLLGRRPEEGLLGGLWELPGGKLEAGETPAACAEREVREELGIEVRARRRLATVRHAYTHLRVTLHAVACERVSGRPRALGCTAWAWVAPEALDRYALPRATHKVLAALQRAGCFP